MSSWFGSSQVAPAPTPEGNNAGAGNSSTGQGKEKMEGAEKDEDSEMDTKSKTKDSAEEKKVEDEANKPEDKAVAKDSKKMKNGCQVCCGKFMSFFAQDAIYGSFVGPHPVSFLLFCALFKKKCPCTDQCSRPLCVASIATKIMNFIMFGIVIILAGFFVAPWPDTVVSIKATTVDTFWPCSKGKRIRYSEHNGGCLFHAGYFMAYRCFYAYSTLMLLMCLLMLGVTSTRDDPHRSKIHHGFWFYKYLFLFIFLLIYFLMLDGELDPEGIFEFVASIFGNIFHLFFSLIELTFVMDVVELWVYYNKGGWANFIHGVVTFLVFLASGIFYVYVWDEYSAQRDFAASSSIIQWPVWPFDNCHDGFKRDPDWEHTALILVSTCMIMLLYIVMTFEKLFGIKNRFGYVSWLQTGVITLFNISYLWSALTNSSNIYSRPRCNRYLYHSWNGLSSDDLQSGSKDQYFEYSGFFHGLMCLFALLYFAFVHGPRSSTAPLSLFYAYMFQIIDRIPVYPDENDVEKQIPLGYVVALERRTVWDDEQTCIAQSWTQFYLMMALGSFSMMMSMTNFTNPWAAQYYNTSNVAYYFKFFTAMIATGIYIILLIIPCNNMHRYGSSGRTVRRRSVGEVLEFKFATDEEEEEFKKAQSAKGSSQPSSAQLGDKESAAAAASEQEKSSEIAKEGTPSATPESPPSSS